MAASGKTSRDVLKDYVASHGGSREIRRILIANNGMAATKCIMSMRSWAFTELGSYDILQFVAMATKDDLEANAEFIRLANSYVEVPPGKNSNNYANVELICKVAQEQRVHAVWPGWGHASENPALPRTLEQMGINFLGPGDTAMYVLGDKIASTILAQTAGVPCIPWNGEGVQAVMQDDGNISKETFDKACLHSYEEALTCANRIGFPVVLKASEGGGGKGIRKCQNAEDLKTGWEQVTMEVVGSPVFMMQLCTKARHLEVQLVGDEHGNVVSLNGRDCSTQRRFQKIFEEGPPIIAQRKSFRQAELSAQRLAKSVGYKGAGTVEYLYTPDTDTFCFLELNPRLQVEHPVTEGITGVNVPALQLQVAMGIPLYRVPDIRRFYGLDPNGSEPIDFMTQDYPYPNCHVIASRITAENPDDAFRPTSGRVDRVRFQSSPSTWGYFSIGANGAIHEYADSQFGHIFSKGKTRDEARKNLQLALKSVYVTGDIRNPVEYLVDLADTVDFVENKIDTAWLDKLIADKSVQKGRETSSELDAIFYAACFRAYRFVKDNSAKMVGGIVRGHLPLRTDLRLLQSFAVDVAHQGTKYAFTVTRLGEDNFALTIADVTLEARIREQPDGSLYVTTEDRVAQVSGLEETLGLRLKVEGGSTIAFPHVRDPSELRSDFNGKLVRYLHSDGDDVADGEPFAELEAMKMIMSLRATAAGKIHHTLAPGAIVSAGSLLANLDLADPSAVQTIKPFTGLFELSLPLEKQVSTGPPPLRKLESVAEMALDDVQKMVAACLCGYKISPNIEKSPTFLVQLIFPHGQERSQEEQEEALRVCRTCLELFLKNEGFFAGLVGGDETQVIGRFTGTPEELLQAVLAHDVLEDTAAIISALLRSASASVELDVDFKPQGEFKASLEAIAALPQEGGYGEVAMLAKQMLERSWDPKDERRQLVREYLQKNKREDLKSFAVSDVFAGQTHWGLDGISSMFTDKDDSIPPKAVEVFIRRVYRGYTLNEFSFFRAQPESFMHAVWASKFEGVPGMTRQGYVVCVPDTKAYQELTKNWKPPQESIDEIHIIVASTQFPEMNDPAMHEATMKELVDNTASFIQSVKPTLEAMQCTKAYVVLARDNFKPIYLHYLKSDGWKEAEQYRNLRSSYPHQLELEQVQNQTKLEKYALNSRCTYAFPGTLTKAEVGKSQNMLFVRAVAYKHMDLNTFEDIMEQELLAGVDLLDRALLDPMMEKAKPVTNIFVHVVSPMAGCTERDKRLIRVLFQKVVQLRLTRQGARLLKLRVEKVEAKVWASATVPLRLTATRTAGWDTIGYQEELDPTTGRGKSWINVDTKDVSTDLSITTPLEGKLQEKRAVARNAQSTYIYDFLGLFRSALLRLWHAYGTSLSQDGSVTLPESVFEATELVLDGDGKLVEQKVKIGENKFAMVAFLCTLTTPEYPDGRQMVLIGNDVTIKAGSFGTVEDDIYQKASMYARDKGLPRIYIACNSGARLGAVEELKSLVEVSWVDANDPNKGFEYIYLSEESLAKLPPGAVKTHPLSSGGATRHVLDAIVGLGLPSVKGGIGVENLQGSGMIAGETSRAYSEIFTLSYVTGRSVGIGAYLNRLGQRNIQMVKGPMILTGYMALNKLLGQQVYTTQDQLGGPHIMVPNGVTHELVRSDQEGVAAILQWLAFVPKDTWSIPSIIPSADAVDRPIGFCPPKSPYDPRHMLAGVRVDGEWQSGFCDEGSFHEYMPGWGKTIIAGRGRLGGMPIGIIAVETRSVERHIPADPADTKSQEVVEAQAGQVWYPDSAFKTAQAIRDFNSGENLPLIVFANWRGFSGGTRDMFAEVLKYGAMIVDALVEYRHPISIYIPPNGELRGGAWVVLDPKINPLRIEMYADVEARGGILEPPAAAEIVFREKQVVEMMHRCDEKLKKLDADKKAGKAVDQDIRAREKQLLPFYRQVSVQYCDLHDRSGRMVAVGAITEELTWKDARRQLHWRLRRRLRETDLARRLQTEVSGTSEEDAMAFAKEISASAATAAGSSSDQAVAEYLESNAKEVMAKVMDKKQALVEAQIYKLISSLPGSRRLDVVRDLVGYSKVLDSQQGASR